MTKYEQLLDLIVNEETEKAEQLFHDIVVEQSRQIYESLLADADQEVSEEIGGSGNPAQDLADATADITSEEEEINVEEGEDDEDGEPVEMPAGMHDEEGAHGDDGVENRVDALEDEMNELLRMIQDLEDKLGGGEDSEMPMDAEMGPMDGEGDGDLEAKESVVREYKETVGEPFKGGKVAQNKADGEKSPVATKGGTMPTAKGVDFAGGDEKGRPAPTAKSMNATTEPSLKKVGGEAAKGTGDGAKSPVVGQK